MARKSGIADMKSCTEGVSAYIESERIFYEDVDNIREILTELLKNMHTML